MHQNFRCCCKSRLQVLYRFWYMVQIAHFFSCFQHLKASNSIPHPHVTWHQSSVPSFKKLNWFEIKFSRNEWNFFELPGGLWIYRMFYIYIHILYVVPVNSLRSINFRLKNTKKYIGMQFSVNRPLVSSEIWMNYSNQVSFPHCTFLGEVV